MTLMHEPFRSFRDLDRMTDRLASQLLSGRPSAAAPSAMPMDVWRDADAYHVTMDLPGVRADDIDLQVERGTLTVSATRRTLPERDSEGGPQVLVAERPGGTFTRQLVLGDGLDVEAVRAEHVDGVLHLVVPVAQAAQPRRIHIGTGEPQREESRVIESRSVPDPASRSQEREPATA